MPFIVRTLMKLRLCLLAGAALQNCRPGDLVNVKRDHLWLVLGKATLLEIGSNAVTICTVNDRLMRP